MNPTTQFVMKPGIIFAIIAVLVILAMVMGRKNDNRAGWGWWIGLGLLLVIVSGFFSFTTLSGGSTIEERYANTTNMRDVMTGVKNDIQAGTSQVRDAVQEAMAEARASIQRSAQTNSRKNKSNATVTVVSSSNTAPPNTVTLQVMVKDKERSQQEDEVKKALLAKAARSVNRWVSERLPIKTYYLNVVDQAWLQDHNAFPEEPQLDKEMLPRTDPSLLDPLYGGTLKVVLTPALQSSLIDMGYAQLQTHMQDEQFTTQGIISICLLGLTGFAGLLALVKTLIVRRVMAA